MARQHRVVAIRRGKKHIEEIRVTNAEGTTMTTWSVADAVQGIDEGTDEFFVANTVWSPVMKWRGKFLRSDPDGCAHSNLENLPEF